MATAVIALTSIKKNFSAAAVRKSQATVRKMKAATTRMLVLVMTSVVMIQARSDGNHGISTRQHGSIQLQVSFQLCVYQGAVSKEVVRLNIRTGENYCI